MAIPFGTGLISRIRPSKTSTRWGRAALTLASLTVPFLIAALTFLSGIGPFAGPVAPTAVEQPLGFSHKRHLAADVLDGDCLVCHTGALDSRSAGRPPTEVCLGCHLGIDPQTEDERRLLTYAETGAEVPWRRVWHLPAHVAYSHRTHVALAGIDCAVCHGPVEATDEALTAPLMTLSMDDCMDCHARWPDHPAATGTVAGSAPAAVTNARAATNAATNTVSNAVSNDCNACHR